MAIKILATSDLHGYISPYSYGNKELQNAGLARLAPYIRANKDQNTILIDNGDTIQGSPLSYYHHLFNEDSINPMALCMNDLHYDYYNIGNHDFNYGQNVLNSFINDLNAKCITGNIQAEKAFDYKYAIKDIDNKKIVFIGATNEYIRTWELPNNIEGVNFINAYDYVKETVEFVKQNEQYDYLCVVYHGGFERNLDGSPLSKESYDNSGYRMISEIDGIDILISGHQHRTICEKILNTFVTQTAFNGQQLAQINIDDSGITGEIISSCDSIDTSIMNIISCEESLTQAWLDQPLGGLKDGDCLIDNEFEARLKKHKCVKFINQIQIDHYQADLAACALFNGALGFRQNITMRDIVSTYVYPNTLVCVKISGKQLKEYLENAAKYFDNQNGTIIINKDYMEPKPLHFEYDMVCGLDYTINSSESFGNRVSNMVFQGKPINDNDSFTMVVNNYRVAGGGNYDVLKECEVVHDDGREMVEIIAEYVMTNSPIIINDQSKVTVI